MLKGPGKPSSRNVQWCGEHTQNGQALGGLTYSKLQGEAWGPLRHPVTFRVNLPAVEQQTQRSK